MNRLIAPALLLAVCAAGFHLAKKSRQEKAIADGAFTCSGCLPPAKPAASTLFSHSQAPAPHLQIAPASAVLPQLTTVQAATRPTEAIPAAQGASPAPASEPLPPGPSPVSNSIPLHTMSTDAATGPYQWYRQGNLTWRVNTSTGRSCIVYATLAEWRKPIVLEHSCGRHA